MSLYYKQDKPLWGIWHIEESEQELLSMLDIPSFYIDKLKELKTETRRREWLASRVLLKELLGCEKQVVYQQNGAPVLEDASFQISFSHTKNYAAVLVASTSAPGIGIDIETIKPTVLKVRRKFVNEEEERYLAEETLLAQLLIMWSAKESMFKAMGVEEVDFRKHLHIEAFLPAASGCIRAFETRTPRRQCFEIYYQLTGEFVLTRITASVL